MFEVHALSRGPRCADGTDLHGGPSPLRSFPFFFFPSLNLLFSRVCKMCTATVRWQFFVVFFLREKEKQRFVSSLGKRAGKTSSEFNLKKKEKKFSHNSPTVQSVPSLLVFTVSLRDCNGDIASSNTAVLLISPYV